MKTSAESLLITISNARRARQTREGQPQNMGGGGRRGGGRTAEWALVCAGTDREKLNEHEICTVSAGGVGGRHGTGRLQCVRE